ncbi:MAG: hypothetical protein JWL90_2183 [Chthoniobacteraceae bacterium]|nr:hypothetical protein [Chthoniobacteraceae bacterium]
MEPVWEGYGGDAQHSAVSSVASQPLSAILWQTPVDLAPQYSDGNLYIHYGSALITAANTVLVPVKTGASGGFRIDAHNGSDGSLLWSQPTDYILPIPAASWVPSYSPVLSAANRLYYPGAGGTIYYRDTPDSAAPAASGQLAFYDIGNYTANKAAFDKNVFINTPITSDSAGNIYFGYQVDKSTSQTLNLHGGIAKISANGVGTWMEAGALAAGMTKVAQNSAPAVSADGSKVYVALNDGYNGRLVELNASNLSLVSKSAPLNAVIDVSSASPTIGPDGDIYFGTNDGYNGRGTMNHFSADLLQIKTPGSFGWDDTASIVPASMVAAYQGTSSYLLMVKYNNYAGRGGDGVNKLAILDPLNLTQIDPVTGLVVMKEVLSIAGVTRDDEYPGAPDAVREWCINTAAVDPFTNSVLVNNEDGKLYRWDLASNSFTESITLTSGLGEAYTPTVIGADGKVYAINNATLFAVGVPEPGSLTLVFAGALTFLGGSRRR